MVGERCTVPLQVQAVEVLLLLGQIHEAAGAPLTALPYVLSCLLHSTVLHMDLLVCPPSLLLCWVHKVLVSCNLLTDMHPT